jgi:deoxyribonuclease-4
MSIAGGLHRALERGAELGCDAVQIFSRSNQQWAVRAIAAEDIFAWQSALRKTRVFPAMVHGSYLVNLAGSDKTLAALSYGIVAEEYRRCHLLGIPYLVIHPGAHLGSGDAAGLERIAAAVNRLHAEQPDNPTELLFENTSGQGTCLGHRFAHLRDLLGLVRDQRRVGVCLDTCHTLAAGYDISTRAGWNKTFTEFEEQVGIRWIRAFHVNDSKCPRGSRVDRHQHIGLGFVGLAGFHCLVNDRRFRSLPMMLETPKPRADSDAVNLAILRALTGRKRISIKAKELVTQHSLLAR